VSSWPSARSSTPAPPFALLAIGEEHALPSLVAASLGTPPPFDEWRGGLGLALPVARRVIEARGGALCRRRANARARGSALRLPLRT